ncbi:hypothetical protein A9R05_06885 [Burkholderia sp. KK1]|nr:hypothetical protein A9R05_06885 [Burkholderia sp. KK1]
MCDPTTAGLMIGSTAMSATGSVMQGNATRNASYAQAAQEESQANSVQAQGYQQAKRIRAQGASNVGQANAALAASGVDVSQGTANDVRTKIAQNSEQDALNTILSADTKATSLRTQAGLDRASGDDAARAGRLGALSSALRAGSSLTMKYGWKTAATTQGK